MSDNVWLCPKVPRVPPACPSGRSNIKMEINVEQWCNDTIGGEMMCCEEPCQGVTVTMINITRNGLELNLDLRD